MPVGGGGGDDGLFAGDALVSEAALTSNGVRVGVCVGVCVEVCVARPWRKT